MEGNLPTGYPQLNNPPANDAHLTPPIHDYGRDEGGTVIGGYVYRGPGGEQGEYFFADYLSNHVWTARVDHGQMVELAQRDKDLIVTGGTLDQIVSFAEDGQGRLYAIGLDGEIFRFTPAPTATPAPPPAGSSVGAPGNDNISGTAGSDTIFGMAGNDTIYAGGGRTPFKTRTSCSMAGKKRSTPP